MVAVYRFLVFAPVVLGAGALFFALGQLAVTTHDAAVWIYGDGVPASQEHSLSLIRWTAQSPWLRVTLFLALFTLLERVVRISTEPQQRERVFGRNEAAIRQRLAAMLVDGHRPPAAVDDLQGERQDGSPARTGG